MSHKNCYVCKKGRFHEIPITHHHHPLSLSCGNNNNAQKEILEKQQRVERFLTDYNNEYQRLYTISSETQWKVNTYIKEGDSITGKANDDAAKAMADFTGSQKVIDSVQLFLQWKASLSEIQVKQLNVILYTAANNPESMKDMVTKKSKQKRNK